jgi:muramoyltetrapeptide carboxypeptidase LdcA involved in peptidoglycan recycling
MIFQAYINWVFRDLLDIIVVVYLDNIIIFLQDIRSHQDHVHKVLKRLYKAGLYYK